GRPATRPRPARPAGRRDPAAGAHVALVRDGVLSGRARGLPHAPRRAGDALQARARPSQAPLRLRRRPRGARAGRRDGGDPMNRKRGRIYLGAGAGALALTAAGLIAFSNGAWGGPTQDGAQETPGMEGMEMGAAEMTRMDMGGMS